MDIAIKILSGMAVVLTVIIVVQHFFYMREINRLIDKLMSRDFSEYKRAVEPSIPTGTRPEANHDVPEDLRVLQNFQLP